MVRHRAVAVADSAQRLTPLTVNLLPGQDVLTVSDMQAKIEALLRWHRLRLRSRADGRASTIAAGRLVVKTGAARAARRRASATPGARRCGATGPRASRSSGLALRWWLEHSKARRRARRCSSATAPAPSPIGALSGASDRRWTSSAARRAPLRRPLRAVADRAAARRLAGRRAGVLARCARPRRPLAGAHRRPRHAAQRRRRRRGDPRAARRAAACAPTSAGRAPVGAQRALRGGAAPGCARRPRLPLRLQPARPRARGRGAGRLARRAAPNASTPAPAAPACSGKPARDRCGCASTRVGRQRRRRRSTGTTAASAPQHQDVAARGRRLRAAARRRRVGLPARGRRRRCGARHHRRRARRRPRRQHGAPDPAAAPARPADAALPAHAAGARAPTAPSCRSRPARSRSTSREPLAALRGAGAVLGLEARGTDVAAWLASARRSAGARAGRRR